MGTLVFTLTLGIMPGLPSSMMPKVPKYGLCTAFLKVVLVFDLRGGVRGTFGPRKCAVLSRSRGIGLKSKHDLQLDLSPSVLCEFKPILSYSTSTGIRRKNERTLLKKVNFGSVDSISRISIRLAYKNYNHHKAPIFLCFEIL